jgi:hypothetical protein
VTPLKHQEMVNLSWARLLMQDDNTVLRVRVMMTRDQHHAVD